MRRPESSTDGTHVGETTARDHPTAHTSAMTDQDFARDWAKLPLKLRLRLKASSGRALTDDELAAFVPTSVNVVGGFWLDDTADPVSRKMIWGDFRRYVESLPSPYLNDREHGMVSWWEHLTPAERVEIRAAAAKAHPTIPDHFIPSLTHGGSVVTAWWTSVTSGPGGATMPRVLVDFIASTDDRIHLTVEPAFRTAARRAARD